MDTTTKTRTLHLAVRADELAPVLGEIARKHPGLRGSSMGDTWEQWCEAPQGEPSELLHVTVDGVGDERQAREVCATAYLRTSGSKVLPSCLTDTDDWSADVTEIVTSE